MSRERPILFRGEMVRAILDLRKTVTRRPVKPEWWRCLDPDDADDRARARTWGPYGAPGDRLWVRETWTTDVAEGPDCFCPDVTRTREVYTYRATDDDYGQPWRPSIFMPRAACRLVLEIVDVRVERLQAITMDDVRAEGWDGHPHEWSSGWDRLYHAKPELQWDADPWVWRIEFKRVEPAA